MADNDGNRRVCSFCDEELAPTAFYRHLHDRTSTVCTGKRRRIDFSGDELSESEHPLHMNSPRALDSTFDLESSDEIESPSETHAHSVFLPHSAQFDDTSEGASYTFSSSDSEDSTASSLEEVWDETDSEDQTTAEDVSSSVNNVVSGISFFLVFYPRFSERAINTLLGFIRALIHYLAVTTGHVLLLQIARALPKTLHAALKHDDYVEYVVCPKCCTLYSLSESTVDNHGQKESKRCTFIEFPNHPHSTRRRACNEILMKRVKIGDKYKLVPRKVYCYRSIVHSLKDMAKRKGFLDKCNHWRAQAREGMGSMMGDIYDGRLWKELKTIHGRPFLALPNNLCLSLNIDWFNPFKETPYSVGAIYLVVLNLPRNERFKEENVILVGTIPGPNEPKQHVNTFLSPLVQDLQMLYDGITFQNPSTILGYTTIRATLACIVCDLPATRKVCGFSNFNAAYGCSKCKKKFVTPAFGSKPLYNGFDCNNWTARNMSDHKCKAQECLEARTNSQRTAIWRECGVKYSELLLIPHLNIIRCHVIDPIHCVFLGLAKHTIQRWKDRDILRANHFSLLQEKVDSIVPPSKIGRIPRKIESSFASFTADEWKKIILIYSVFALNGIIDDAHYKCWCLLVDSCSIFCQPIVSTSRIDQGHTLLVEFCKLFETLYGPECCTPNMHMACHLKDCMLDFGPFSSFWCFPFERYNGILEGISKSWVLPEKQIFQKFFAMQKVKLLGFSKSNEDDFLAIVYEQIQSKPKEDYSSVGQTQAQDVIIMQQIKNFTCNVSIIDAEKKGYQCLVPPYKEKYFRDSELSYLHEMYNSLYPGRDIAKLSRFYKEYKKCIINCEEYNSSHSRSQRSTAIAAKWPNVLGIDTRGEAPLRIGNVVSFIEHDVDIAVSSICNTPTITKNHILVHVQWYGDHPHRDYLHSTTVLCSTVHESCACFMPISRLMCRCAISSPHSLTFDYGVDHVLVAVPLIKYVELELFCDISL